MSTHDAWRMLSMCLREPRRPVDDLIDRLLDPDGAEWFRRALRAHGMTEAIERRILDGQITLEELTALKEAAKTRAVDAATTDEALGALAVYCLCTAAALRLHRALISSQGREVWDALLVDLAEVAPEPWGIVLADAAAAA